LRGQSWDATLDVCAYWPGQVQELAEQLDGRGGHHLQVSSVSAYAEDTPAGADESAALAELAALGPDAVADPDALEMTGQTYGPLKAPASEPPSTSSVPPARRSSVPRTSSDPTTPPAGSTGGWTGSRAAVRCCAPVRPARHCR
jgi:hypothetical protein